MTVYGPDNIFRRIDSADDLFDKRVKFIRLGVSHCIGNIERCSPALYRCFKDFDEERHLRTACILCGKFNVVYQRFCKADAVAYLCKDTLFVELKLILHMYGACCNKGVYARPLCVLYSFRCTPYILCPRPRKSRYYRALYLTGDCLYGFEVAG